mmetsp:Transcript_112144/g.362081  ORF Transcript_112144/g.362081 Transcript_112144/m.362081 type:complete len:209 (+) Transcript_112144:248-874(+)
MGARESAQPRTTATGFWPPPESAARRLVLDLNWPSLPWAQLRLPARSAAWASSRGTGGASAVRAASPTGRLLRRLPREGRLSHDLHLAAEHVEIGVMDLQRTCGHAVVDHGARGDERLDGVPDVELRCRDADLLEGGVGLLQEGVPGRGDEGPHDSHDLLTLAAGAGAPQRRHVLLAALQGHDSQHQGRHEGPDICQWDLDGEVLAKG